MCVCVGNYALLRGKRRVGYLFRRQEEKTNLTGGARATLSRTSIATWSHCGRVSLSPSLYRVTIPLAYSPLPPHRLVRTAPHFVITVNIHTHMYVYKLYLCVCVCKGWYPVTFTPPPQHHGERALWSACQNRKYASDARDEITRARFFFSSRVRTIILKCISAAAAVPTDFFFLTHFILLFREFFPDTQLSLYVCVLFSRHHDHKIDIHRPHRRRPLVLPYSRGRAPQAEGSVFEPVVKQTNIWKNIRG